MKAQTGRAAWGFFLSVYMPECSGMRSLECKRLTVLCFEWVFSCDRSTRASDFSRQKVRWNESDHFRLYFLMLIRFEIEQAVIVGELNSVTLPPHAVRVFLWLSESLLLPRLFLPWIKYLLCYLWLMVDLYLWPSLSHFHNSYRSVCEEEYLQCTVLVFCRRITLVFMRSLSHMLCFVEACAQICLPVFCLN